MSGLRRVTFVETTAQLGGAQISLLELVRHLRDRIAITLVLPHDGPMAEAAARAGATVTFVTWPDGIKGVGERAKRPSLTGLLRVAAAAPRFIQRLRAQLRSTQPDAVVSNGIKAHIFCALAAAPTPLIWYLRDGAEGRRLSSFVLRRCARRVSAAIAISQYVARQAAAFLPRSTRVDVIYNIVDGNTFARASAAPPDVRKRPGEIWFGVIGALTPIKGQDVFLEAAAIVLRHVPNARFVIVGSNFYLAEAGHGFEQTLRRSAARRGLDDHVLFLGQRTDVPAIMTQLDVVVQPNRGPEGFGRTVVEAMCSGVPVIASELGGPIELIVNGETGVLTKPLDVTALAAAMVDLAGHPDRRRALADRARASATRFTDAAIAVTRFQQLVEFAVA